MSGNTVLISSFYNTKTTNILTNDNVILLNLIMRIKGGILLVLDIVKGNSTRFGAVSSVLLNSLSFARGYYS